MPLFFISSDLWHHVSHELLTSKARFHCHYEDRVHIRHVRQDFLHWCPWLDTYPNLIDINSYSYIPSTSIAKEFIIDPPLTTSSIAYLHSSVPDLFYQVTRIFCNYRDICHATNTTLCLPLTSCFEMKGVLVCPCVCHLVDPLAKDKEIKHRGD